MISTEIPPAVTPTRAQESLIRRSRSLANKESALAIITSNRFIRLAIVERYYDTFVTSLFHCHHFVLPCFLIRTMLIQ